MDSIGNAHSEASEAEVRHQAKRITDSEVFSEAERLSQFLTFIVEETLNGQSDQIKAQTVAMAVFERGTDFNPQTDPIVRVEAGRLRSKLAEYYADKGTSDPVIIHVPKGRYVPKFELRSDTGNPDRERESTAPAKQRRTYILGLVLVSLIVIAGLAVWFGLQQTNKPNAPVVKSEAHAAFIDARRVARPPHLKDRVAAGMVLARSAQIADPNFAGGFAAGSFLHWVNVVFGHTASPDQEIAQAMELADIAIKIDPGFSWGHQALSRALLSVGDETGAIEAAKRAVDLDPDNAEMHGNLGLILISFGRSQEAIEPIQYALKLSGNSVRAPYRNYLGMAHFHNRNYDTASATIEGNLNIGGPTGPHMFAYLAGSYAMLDRKGKAFQFAEKVKSDESGFPVGVFVRNVLVDQETELQLFSALERAGLSLADQ